MPPPIVTATIQACAINLTSSILAQILSHYRSSTLQPFTLDTTSVYQFLIYTLLSCPPNFMFQQLLESTFPGYPPNPPKSVDGKRKAGGGEAENVKVKVDDDGEGVVVERKLNIRNTVCKVLVDQTIGHALHTVGFLAGMGALRGKGSEEIWGDSLDDFWPLMFAGYKFWPAVSLLNFLLIPVEKRVVFGSLVGLGWGVFLVLRTSRQVGQE